MNKRRLIYVAVVLVLVFGIAAAQAAENTKTTSIPANQKAMKGSPVNSASQSRMVFFYEDTYGETGVAYFADSEHLYFPTGIGIDGGDNLWVAESSGERALKYSGNGNFLMSIGTAGLIDIADETHFAEPREAAVDGDGNSWIADAASHRVIKFDAAGKFLRQLGVTWESGSDNSHFNDPFGIAFDSSGYIYVSDAQNHRIQVFESNGFYSKTIGVTGVSGTDNSHFNYPVRVEVDSSDNLYVVDLLNHRVQIFDKDHNYSATLGVSGVPGWDNAHFDRPQGVAVDDDYIYIVDENHRVQIFNRNSHSYHSTLGSWGSGDYEFNGPSDVAVDSNGNLYVSDSYNHRVQKFNSSLTYVRTFGTTDVPYLSDGYHFNGPFDVAVNNDGNIALVEGWWYGHRLIVLDSAGEPQFIIGEAGISGSDNAHFNDPQGIAFDADGNIYVGDCWNHRVQIFDANGNYLSTLGTGYGQGNGQFNCPAGLAFDDSDNLYVADTENYRVQIFDSDLNYVATLGVTGESGSDNFRFNYPRAVEVDSRGNIYVADTFNHRVQVFDSSYAWQMTLGVTGECINDDIVHLCEPFGIALDLNNNVYVSEKFGPHVEVFDPSGVYLTTIGSDWGIAIGQFRFPAGVEIDKEGNVFIADVENHRIQKYVPGTPVFLPFVGLNQP
jgi:sugar lactone lactonase YvrE